MAGITVKDINDNPVEVASNSGKLNAALTTGIIGTSAAGLALLGGNGLGGLFGGNNNAVDKDMYYRDMINQINVTNSQFSDVNSKICELQASIAVNTTANQYQNRINDIMFANVDNRFATEQVINDLNRNLAICTSMKDVIRGEVMLSPTRLADNYIAPSRVLSSYLPREYTPAPFQGYGAPFGYDPCGC